MTTIARIVLPFALVTTLACAATLSTLDIAGQSEITANTIDFTPFIAGAVYNGTGQTVATGAGSGVFSGISMFQAGTIVDRDTAGGSVPAQPAGGVILVENWLTFPGLPGLALDLTTISAGSYSSADCGSPPASAQTCTPPPNSLVIGPSPFNFANVVDAGAGLFGLSSSATMLVGGAIRNTATNATVGSFSGIFVFGFKGQPYQTTLADLAGGGSAVVSYAGTIVSTDADIGNDPTVPEPSTFGLMATGAILFLAWRKRRM